VGGEAVAWVDIDFDIDFDVDVDIDLNIDRLLVPMVIWINCWQRAV